MRKFLPWLLSIPLLVVALGLLGSAAMNRWLSGESFHTLLEQKASQALHAKTSFGPLHWGWFELSSPIFTPKGKGKPSYANSKPADSTGS